jgi:hypothetical protein
MDLLTIIVILTSSAAMVFVFTVAQGLERRAKGLPVWDASGYSWTRSIAYVAIMFGVAAGLVQLYKVGKLNVITDVAPVISGTIWLIVLGFGLVKRQ